MKNIKLQGATSTGATNIRYDAPSQSLYVDYPRGKYRYQNVPPEFVARLEGAVVGIGEILRELRDTKLYPVEKL